MFESQIFITQEKISGNLQAMRKVPFQIIKNPTDVTYQFIDPNKKTNQHRNNLSPYYSKKKIPS